MGMERLEMKRLLTVNQLCALQRITIRTMKDESETVDG